MSNVSYQSLIENTMPCSGPISLPVDLKYASCFAATSSASGMSALLSVASVMLRAFRAVEPASRAGGRPEIHGDEGIELAGVLDRGERPENALRLVDT